ncbi:MAG: hypothetical protein ACK5JS_01670 [Mangrovibacterium sp.]
MQVHYISLNPTFSPTFTASISLLAWVIMEVVAVTYKLHILKLGVLNCSERANRNSLVIHA